MKNKALQNALLITAVIVVAITLILAFSFRSEENGDSRKIGYIMTGSTDEYGWNGMNYEGIEAACKKLGAQLVVKENVGDGMGMCAQAVSELAESGAGMIILSSYGYPSEVKDVITEYPEISFYGNSADFYSDNMSSYFGRMYQVRYLSGIIAGFTTENNKIGYVAAMANDEVNRGINAFTLGVKRANPEAEVTVIWTGAWDDGEKAVQAAETLIREENIDLVTYHQNKDYVIEAAERAGIYSIGYNAVSENCSEKYLTAAVWDWEQLYTDIVKDFIQGKANERQHYWLGIDKGAVSLSEYSSLVSEEARAEVEKARDEILLGNDVFSGEIYDSEGTLRCGKDEFISDSALMSDFDWYVDGVRIYD